MNKFIAPNGAQPNYNAVMFLSPSDKFKRNKGLNFKEDGEFRGVCAFGANTLIACYNHLDGEFSASDFWMMCKECPNRFDKDIREKWSKIKTEKFNAEYLNNLFRDAIEIENPSYFVYFVSDARFVKIGIAKEPYKRLIDLQIGNAMPLSVLYLIPLRDENSARIVEHKLHNFYSEYQKSGEWFDISDKLDKKSFKQMFSPEIYKIAGGKNGQ